MLICTPYGSNHVIVSAVDTILGTYQEHVDDEVSSKASNIMTSYVAVARDYKQKDNDEERDNDLKLNLNKNS